MKTCTVWQLHNLHGQCSADVCVLHQQVAFGACVFSRCLPRQTLSQNCWKVNCRHQAPFCPRIAWGLRELGASGTGHRASSDSEKRTLVRHEHTRRRRAFPRHPLTAFTATVSRCRICWPWLTTVPQHGKVLPLFVSPVTQTPLDESLLTGGQSRASILSHRLCSGSSRPRAADLGTQSRAPGGSRAVFCSSSSRFLGFAPVISRDTGAGLGAGSGPHHRCLPLCTRPDVSRRE